ncbi:MAG: FAD-dependent oxidoreductase, partial [Frankiaceae bacterium]
MPGNLEEDLGGDPCPRGDAGMNAAASASGAPGASGAAGPGERVVVVGGGLAGITAALACADAGLPVTLLETRPRLGGATSSFRRGELMIDNGQHVFLRCCSAYRGLLARLGSEHLTSLQPRLDIPVLAEGGRSARLRRSRLPAPLHLAGSLTRYGLISWSERVAFARAARALQKVDRDDPATD